MPDLNTFSRIFKQYKDTQTKIEKYLEYTENHTRMIEAFEVSGLAFDVDTHISKPWEAVKATGLFSDHDVVDTFERGNEILVSDKFFGKVAFLDDNTIKREDSTETKALKLHIENAQMAYLDPNEASDTGVLYIKNSTDKKLFVNGGYFHERFHAQIREQHHTEFRDLEDRLELGKEQFYREKKDAQKADEIRRMNDILASFEEVAANVRTYEFMGRDQKFVEMVYERYRLNPNDEESVKDFFTFGTKNEQNMIKLAEALTTLSIIDYDVGNDLIKRFKSEYSFMSIGRRVIKKIELFSRSFTLDENAFNTLRKFLKGVKDG